MDKKFRITFFSMIFALAACNHKDPVPVTSPSPRPTNKHNSKAVTTTPLPAPQLDCKALSKAPGCIALGALEEAQKLLRSYQAQIILSYFSTKHRPPLSDYDAARKRVVDQLTSAEDVDPIDQASISHVSAAFMDCLHTIDAAFKVPRAEFSARTDACVAHVARLLDDLRLNFHLAGFHPAPNFKNLRWGDTLSKVSSMLNQKPIQSSDGKYVYETKLANHSTLMVLSFVNGKLASGGYLFQDKHSSENDYISDFDAIDKLLKEKYGNPVYSSMFWSNDLFKDNPQRYGLAIASGQMRKVSEWDTPSTEIRHAITGDNFHITHGIIYQAVEYSWAIQHGEDKKAKAEL